MNIIIALPCYNEEQLLAASVNTVVAYCRAHVHHQWRVIIADNASTDRTATIGQELALAMPQEVSYLHVAMQGKGAAIRAAWDSVDADVYCFMDADLSTNLSALTAGITALEQGADVVYGSRAHHDSQVTRTFSRRLWSWGYRQLLQRVLHTTVSDAPCGFKIITTAVKQTIVPQVQNEGWFFDSEFLLLAEHGGYRLQAIPVTWTDPRESTDKTRVQVPALVREYWRQAMSLRRRLR